MTYKITFLRKIIQGFVENYDVLLKDLDMLMIQILTPIIIII